MWATLNGIVTILGLVVFFGIVWWAFSKKRRKDNLCISFYAFL